MSRFQRAVKYQSKGRVALVGPAGSGKSYTMLQLARLLAGPDGKIAAIDTEHGSLSKYADRFDFDVVELDSFSLPNFMDSLEDAENGGYAVFCCDSLSHFWMGKDGALEFVDMAAKRHRDNMGGWKDFRPHERKMVDAILASRCHVICTLRTKTDYVTEEKLINGQKKTVRVKVGLAPVQREGLEYEFDLVGTMNDDNEMLIDKTRCDAYAGKVLGKPGPKEWQPFAEWLTGAPLQVKPAVAPVSSLSPVPVVVVPVAHVVTDADLPEILGGTFVAPPNPAEQLKASARAAMSSNGDEKLWRTKGEMRTCFEQARCQLMAFDDDPSMPFGESIFHAELLTSKVERPHYQFKTLTEALDCYERIRQRITTLELNAHSGALATLSQETAL